jgi:hypothetical protein
VGDLADYMWALLGYWKWFVGGYVFMVDTVLRRNFATMSRRMDELLPAKKRRQFELAAMSIAVLFAGFQAWRDEHQSRLKAIKQIDPTSIRDEIKKLTARRWPPLSDEEIAKAQASLRGLKQQTVTILCNYSDCLDLAESLFKIFHELNWQASVETGLGSGGEGASVWTDNAVAPAIVEAISAATAGRLRMSLHPRHSDTTTFFDQNITIQIDRRTS